MESGEEFLLDDSTYLEISQYLSKRLQESVVPQGTGIWGKTLRSWWLENHNSTQLEDPELCTLKKKQARAAIQRMVKV